MSASLQRALFAVAFMGLGSVGTMTAGAYAGEHGDGRRAMMQKLVADLDLNEAQKAKGKDVKEDIQARWAEHKRDRLAVADELIAKIETGDRKGIHHLVGERMDALGDTLDESIDDVLDFVDTLDARQKQALVDDLRQAVAAKRRAE